MSETSKRVLASHATFEYASTLAREVEALEAEIDELTRRVEKLEKKQ